MEIAGGRIDKRETERRIRAATPQGWQFLKVNWKSGIAHFADLHKRRVFIPLSIPQNPDSAS